MKSRNASVLVGVLWCVALLTVVVVGALYTTRLSLGAAKNFEDKIQAHYLAIAGVEQAKAHLFHESISRRKAGNPLGTPFELPVLEKDVTLGRGAFHLLPQASDPPGRTVVVRDEESRLNVNTASLQELMRLPGMQQEMAAAIIDWRDQDKAPQPNGAEAEYYASLNPPYLPRNNRLESLREMLLIRGISSADLLGEDRNQNGILDPGEDLDRDGQLQAGWSEFLCLHSQVANVRANGEARVNLQAGSENDFKDIGLDDKLAKAIVAWNQRQRIENIADLLEVTELAPDRDNQGNPRPNQSGSGRNQNQNRPGQGPGQNSAQNMQPVGPKLIDQTKLQEMADDVKANETVTLSGPININTAPVRVLACLNGVSEELAQAIVTERESLGYFPNIAGLLKVSGMTTEIFKQISNRVTARGETFRIVSEGKVASTGARERIEAIVRVSDGALTVLSVRENL